MIGACRKPCAQLLTPTRPQSSNCQGRAPLRCPSCCLALTLQEVLLTVLYLPRAPTPVCCLSSWGAALGPFLHGDTVGRAPSRAQPSLAVSDPSTRTSRLATSILRAPCQSDVSNFPTDYPRHRHPGEKQLLYPDVGTLTGGRNQECSLTYVAPEGFLDKAVGWGWGTEGAGGQRGTRWGHEDSRGLAPRSPLALSGSSRGPAPGRLG